MPDPATTTARYTDAWHATQDAAERAWLDEWMRGNICPLCLTACPRTQPAATVAASLVTIGRS